MDNPFSPPVAQSNRIPLGDFDKKVLKTYLGLRGIRPTRMTYINYKKRTFLFMVAATILFSTIASTTSDPDHRAVMCVLVGAMGSQLLTLLLISIKYPVSGRLLSKVIDYDKVEDFILNGEPISDDRARGA